MINRIVLSFVAVLLAASALAVDLTDAQRAAIEERIKPVGESCMLGDSSCGGAAAPVAGGAPRSGEEVFNAACTACHSTGAAGAPKYGDVAAWEPRIAKGMDALYNSGVNGVPGTGMVAKGGCAACSEEEIDAAVDYMVAGSQ
ncbi:MAG: c-type cytochrome [Halioglobus sp.]